MPLASGDRLNVYEILAPLGAGGMGEVYRATDSRLGREVAIKVLSETFTTDPDRLARFEREARLLASLNHPHIGAIHGLEESSGIRFLVLELVPGETLAERISHRRDRPGVGSDSPTEIEETLRISRQIAEALEAAHDKGIIHRDLKPANVKVTPGGKVKVLDFGLAKDVAGEANDGDVFASPTITAAATQGGVILGTAPYMSPEQARGKQLDKRTDIWAFGCVLYEMLTGKRAFGGETATDIITSIIHKEPDWQALPTTVPLKIQDLLRRCLRKDLNGRLRDIGDARIEIDEALSAPLAPAMTESATIGGASGRRTLAVVFSSVVLGVVVGAVAIWNLKPASPGATRSVTRLNLELPPATQLAGLRLPAVTLSPDGTYVAYVANRDGNQQIYLRSMDSLEARPIAGTDGATSLFFSPDGQWLGFVADRRLKKVATSGGAPVSLCAVQGSIFGASWGAKNKILFGPRFNSGLWEVPVSGGTPRPVTTLDPKKNEAGHHWPEFLPGGDAILFTVVVGSYDDALIEVQSLQTGERRVLVQGGSYARYVPTGHLVYIRAGTLMAVAFDLKRLEVTGSPVPIGEEVMQSASGVGQFSFSRFGDLVYVPGGILAAQQTLVWVDRRGAAKTLAVSAQAYRHPRISPDGQRLAIWIVSAARCNVAVYNLAQEVWTRLTFDADNHAPIWTPDEKAVTFQSNQAGSYNLFSKPADGGGRGEQLTKSEYEPYPGSWSPDGKVLAFTEFHSETGWDIWLLPMEGDRKPQPFLQTGSNELMPVFSPDGRWLAYVSDETGRPEIFVSSYSGPAGKWQVSTDGGTEPVWSRNSPELLYRHRETVMTVEITTRPTFRAAKPRPLFQGVRESATELWFANYDITPDGRRLLTVKGSEQETQTTRIHVVLQWFEELKRRVPPS